MAFPAWGSIAPEHGRIIADVHRVSAAALDRDVPTLDGAQVASFERRPFFVRPRPFFARPFFDEDLFFDREDVFDRDRIFFDEEPFFDREDFFDRDRFFDRDKDRDRDD
jgi:hypothetical protein